MPQLGRSREDFAWLAGFWDGEGSVSPLNTAYSIHYPVFAVSQAGDEGEALCRRVARIAGVRASISGPIIKPGRSPVWKVRISGHERVQYLLAACWAWLSETKRAQAIRVLRAFLESRPTRMKRTHCPRCGCEWIEPNIAYNPANNSWRCRVCRRKNPAGARPAAQYRRVHFDADRTARRPSTHEPPRVVRA